MKIKRAILGVPALFLLALGLPASAQTDLTCDDITFGPDVTSKFPTVAENCWDVVEIDGERYAKMRVRVIRKPRGNNVKFRFVQPDGSLSKTQSTTVPDDWRANIAGESYRMAEVDAGQEMSIFLPSNRWEAHVAPDTTTAVTTFVWVVLVDEQYEELPTTASPLPLIGLLGFGGLFAAFMLRVFRRRTL